MAMKITCCKDCTKRHIGCHASCEDYIKQKTELDRIRETNHDADEIKRHNLIASYDYYARMQQSKRRRKR